MTGLTLLIPVALGLGLLGLFAFQWALRSGQFDDLDGAALRVLIDEDDEPVGEADKDAVKDAGNSEEPQP
ncbi:MAG: cbb3-type cytochrome oxidase assembly protein CcoS [Pseudomonadota bacterium]